jgi:hypothetical protein
MGQFPWPGISYTHEGRAGRLYLGPTLSALFAPGSRFCNLEELEGVFLLFQPEVQKSPHELLEQVLGAMCRQRDLEEKAAPIHFVPIPGIGDPTDYEAIIQGIRQWLESDPFDLDSQRAAKFNTRIVVNLSPGTPAMSTCWLLLRWNGSLGRAPSVVEFVQGSGGLHVGEGPHNPLRTVPIDVLSRMIGQRPAAPEGPSEPFLGLESFTGPPYDALRQKIEHAAMLGLPILLHGPRGSGKTFAAFYYHQRRRYWRSLQSDPPRDQSEPRPKGRAATAKTVTPVGEVYPERVSGNNFVIVTLSEFADLDNLRDALFGWAKYAWNLAHERYDGLLGEAHEGTLFLDEIHHLDRKLQSALLEPLNSQRFRPKMARYRVISNFDLVVATNDPVWRDKLADDFRDRIERIVLEMPAFRDLQRANFETLWSFWDFTLRRRCRECELDSGMDSPDDGCRTCQAMLRNIFKIHSLPGNWRDLLRLADNILLRFTDPRWGRPTALRWNPGELEHAIRETFAGY